MLREGGFPSSIRTCYTASFFYRDVISLSAAVPPLLMIFFFFFNSCLRFSSFSLSVYSLRLRMFGLQNIFDYADCFGKSPPIALAGVNSHARECVERHNDGSLGCKITSGDYGLRRLFVANSSDAAQLELVSWWLERQRDYPLHITVYFSGTESLNDISVWENFSQRLSKSTVEHTFELAVEGIESLPHFAVLSQWSEGINLRKCKLTTLEPLGGFEQLSELQLAYCVGTFSLDSLVACPNLTTVHVSYCSGVTGVEALDKLCHLKNVALRSCDITNVDFLKDCHMLVSVRVPGCEGLTSLSALSGLQKLTTVDAWGTNITEVDSLSACAALESVCVIGCEGLTSLSGLSGLRHLRTVEAGRTNITEVGSLSGCLALEYIGVVGCKKLTSLGGLSGLQKLKVIDATCAGITEIGSLAGCTSLETVYINYCEGLTSLSGLSGLPNLKYVDATASPVPRDEHPEGWSPHTVITFADV
ncbi:hypothetical protein AGDE_12954 [Angomonas deanei]|uniref:Uncharacterized protein n=1 Tax=Angomonas deanei TaxID=59799 RepID=A0A7G2CJA3_9TRYP|nr:hypothetical protein AGDE_12954 [Angomonas deanei]CAD2218693.1 hypothetical protein, conserved [Angomonas deanei]|eukprot:EPY23203.1 hypothetical protein AGDE_12954 [Angomonas deanei]